MLALVPAIALPQLDAAAGNGAPTIVSRNIAPWTQNVQILAVVAARFDRPVTNVTTQTFVLRDSRGRIVPAFIRMNAESTRVELVPRRLLKPSERYSVRVAGVRSQSGVSMAPSTWAFRTSAEPRSGTSFRPARSITIRPGTVTGIQIDRRGRIVQTRSVRAPQAMSVTVDALVKIRGARYYRVVSGDLAVSYVSAELVVTEPRPAETAAPTPTATPASSSPPPTAAPSSTPSAVATPVATTPPTPRPSSAATPRPSASAAPVVPPQGGDFILMSRSRLASLPTSGAAWNQLVAAANANPGRPNLADMNQNNNVYVLAQALVYARTGEAKYRTSVISNLKAAIGTEGGSTLPLGREAAAYALAADFIDLASVDPAFEANVFRPWLRSLLSIQLEGRTLRSTHEQRANNWGTHASGSRAVIAAYLGDAAELARVATVFRGWVGERSAYAGFAYGDLWWQADPSRPVGINPPGSTLNGRSVDGVIPDDQRRTGAFTWPPPCGSYPHEAMDGALLTAEVLSRHGYAAYGWGSNALLRAERWLVDTGCPASGDNVWHLPLLDARYGSNFWNGAPVRPGKNFGWTDWLYGS